MKLLTVSADAKTVKGEKRGYLTGILYLAPADESGVMNTCPMATAGCKAACLFTAGRAAIFPKVNQARIRKTHEYHNDPVAFKEQLKRDISALVRKAKRENMIPAVRVNGTSDLPKLALEMAAAFSDVQFYDYTKIPRPWQRMTANYHLTFSLSELNKADAVEALSHGVNVAVVFDNRKGEPLPATWEGFNVVSGDESDLRFLDKGKGVVIGLYAKGRAKKDTSGFVQSSKLVTITMAAKAGQ
jgi:hypothetical protein